MVRTQTDHGRAGNSAACTAMTDCDDTNPTVHPRAPELPGDGLDNDCSGNGDAAVDETVGVFLEEGMINSSGLDDTFQYRGQ